MSVVFNPEKLAVSRRSFFKASAATAGGLLIGFYLPENSKLAADSTPSSRSTDPKLNAFVRIGTDDSVTLTVHRAELGQGSMTALPMLLAEELDCDWSKIRTEFAKVDPVNYGVFGSPVLQGVFGSLSIRGSWDQLRQAGATAREMLVGAAAQKWSVDKSQCRAEKSTVINTATNARLTYGSLAEAACQNAASGESCVEELISLSK